MKYEPYNYQQYCTERIITDAALGLFLDMGLGKTVITLTAINELRYNRWAVQRVLIIAPKKVAEGTWSKEAGKWDHLQHLRISLVCGSQHGPLTWWCWMSPPALRTGRANGLRH